MRQRNQTKVNIGRVAETVKLSPLSQNVTVKIVGALNNKKYKTRTISGIVSETGLAKGVIIEAISNNNELKKAIKISPIRSRGGEALITTKERFAKESTLKEKFVDFFATRRVEAFDVE